MRYTRGSFTWDFGKILVLLGALWDFKGLDNLITLLSFDQLRAEMYFKPNLYFTKSVFYICNVF